MKFYVKGLAQALFDESGDALFLFDPDTDELIDVNPMAERLTGMSASKMFRYPATYWFSSEEPKGMDQLRLASHETGIFHSQEGFVLRTAQEDVQIPINLTVTRLHVQPKTLGLITARDVSKQREIHTRLQAMEAEHRARMASVTDCIWSAEIVSPGRVEFRFVSPVVKQITGYPPEFFFQGLHRWLSIVHEDDRRSWKQAWKRLKAGNPVQQEYRIAGKDGNVRWIRDSVEVQKNRRSRSISVNGILSEITERKQAEETLRDRETRLRFLVEQMPAILWTTDKDLVITSSNGGALASLGLLPDQVVGMKMTEYLQCDDPDFQPLAAHRRALTGENVTYEMDWQGRWFQVHIEPLCDADDAIVGTIGIAVDATERKQAESNLKASERRFRDLFESSPDAIFVEDIDGNVLDANPAACNLHGYRRQELLGKNVLELVPPDKREEVQRVFARFLQNELHQAEGFSWTADQRAVPVELSVSHIDYGGQPALLLHVRDITLRKRAEEEQRRFEEKMLQAQKLESLGVLAGGIAHDFNNLLVGVLGYAELAMRGLPQDSPASNDIRQIQEGAMRLSELSQQMLAYSGKGKFVIRPFDLSKLIKEMTQLLEASISKKAELHFELRQGLPAVEGDKTQIRQVVLNLVTNASEALGENSGPISVSTGTVRADRKFLETALIGDSHAEGDYVYLKVSDGGCGIDSETLSKMFDPFFTTKFTGRGLGLATVHGIVRGHDGALKVDSTVGEGATFTALFPITKKSVAETPTNAKPWRGKGTVVLADDEPGVREVAKRMLTTLGFKVRVANDGEQALRLIEQQANLELVLLDLLMPRMGGEETIHELRRMGLQAPVVLMSGFDEHELTDRLGDRGFAGFLQKPFRFDALKEVVRGALTVNARKNGEGKNTVER